MQRGGQPGNRNAAKSKPWVDAIKRALARREQYGGQGLNQLAEKLLDKVEEGDMQAIKELGDRLDGKPAQAIVGDPDNPVHTVSRIERVIVDRSTDSDT